MIGSDDDTQPILPPPLPGDTTKPWVGPCLANYPCGKGIFVRSVAHGGDPELFAERCAWLGLKWVMIQAAWAKPDRLIVNDASRYPEYGQALRARGITPWVWGWPTPERMAPFLGACMHALHQLGAVGLVINPEQPWRKGHRADAATFVEMCRNALGDRLLGMTSYGGGPGYIASFPWDEFAACDFAIPQWYDQHHSLGPGYPVAAARRYLKAGYRVLIPAMGASKAHDPQCMARHLAQSPIPAGAVCWWDLYWLLLSEQRSQFVRDYQIPPVTGGLQA